MTEAAPFEARRRETDGVVLGVDGPLQRPALDLREVVEPLLDRALERGVLVIFGVVPILLLALLGRQPAFVGALERGCQQLLDTGVDVSPERFDREVGPVGEQLGTATETGGADRRSLREVGKRRTPGRDQHVLRWAALGDARDHQVGGLVGRHVLHRVDGGVQLAVDDLLVETPDERAGRPQPVDEFVPDLVAGRLDGDEFDRVLIDTLRVFLRWAVSIDAVDPELPDKVQSPSLRKGENEKTTHIDTETAEQILRYLRKYEYATLPHVVWELYWSSGMRRGASRALDVSDFDMEERYVDVKHRPETGTPLKNKYEGERPVSLSEAVTTVIQDWIDSQRPDVTDDYGRSPLLSTKYGRAHGQTLQKYIYQWSRPCVIGLDCPHGRDPDDCDAMDNNSAAHLCPDSVAPHDIRRSSITHALRQDAPVTAVSDRSDVSPDVLEKHYNQMSAEEKMEKRREFFENI